MKKAMIESGTRIQNNLELITHLQTEMCEFKESIDIEVVKENLEINIYDNLEIHSTQLSESNESKITSIAHFYAEL